jgi:hypothetical protein
MQARPYRFTRTPMEKAPPPQQFEDIIRADAVTTFLASPPLPKSNQLRVDHITTALLDMAVDKDTHIADRKLLAPEPSERVAETLWEA